MFTSFLIPSVFEDVRARHLCVFYKQLGAIGRDRVSFVGEPAYFEAPIVLEASGRPEWRQSWREAYGYEPPDDLTGVAHQTLPADLFAARLRRLGSSWKLYGQLVTRRLPELETAFADALEVLDRRARVEAVLAFANNPSVAHVAARRGLPVVHNEFGPLRSPDYIMTGYWDRGGVSHSSDAARRYRTFRRAALTAGVPLLSREEILDVLRRTPLPAPSTEAPCRIGVALQGDENAYVHGVGALDLISMARRHARPGEILVRYHSGSVARYPESLAVTDTSDSATAFIQRCEAVLTVSSGVALEALLLGRRAIVVGDSPFALAADRTLDARPRHAGAEQLRMLNFLAFGYLVPGALMFDPAYIRWRLTGPCELDIYRHHQRWYRARLLDLPQPEQPAVALAAAAKLLDAVPHDDATVPLVVFGAGAATAAVIAQLRSERFAVQGIFDNDHAKWGTQLSGLAIDRPGFRDGASIVIASLTHAAAIGDQLGRLGYPPERILRLR